jgi:hypothetical protein
MRDSALPKGSGKNKQPNRLMKMRRLGCLF